MDYLAVLEFLFTFIGFICAFIILKRNIKYIGNIFFGFGYLCYAIPGFLLFLSHRLPNEDLIIFSVQSMVAGGAIGIGLLYLGTRIFFKGKSQITKKLILLVLGIGLVILIIAFGDPNSVQVISINPVNSQLNLILGASILVWHLIMASLSINHLENVRKSAIEENDIQTNRKIKYIIAGFFLSIIALLIYSVGNFGESSIIDILFLLFSTIDLICIYRGLIKS